MLILIVSTGGGPRFPSGRVAFGCSQFSGNCFSRLGYHPSTSFLECEPGPEWSPGVLLVSCERLDAPHAPVCPSSSHSEGPRKSYVAAQAFCSREARNKRAVSAGGGRERKVWGGGGVNAFQALMQRPPLLMVKLHQFRQFNQFLYASFSA